MKIMHVDKIVWHRVYELSFLFEHYGLGRVELEGAGIAIRDVWPHQVVRGKDILAYVQHENTANEHEKTTKRH